MLRLRRYALFGALVFVLLPAAAFAQGAGDEQYSDPFAGQQQGSSSPAPTSQSNPSNSNSGSQQAGTPSSSGDATASTGTSGDPSSSSSSASALPRTGMRIWPLALLGSLMLLGGLLLRLGLGPVRRRTASSPLTLGSDVRLVRR